MVEEYLCRQGMTQLDKQQLFSDSDRCKVLDIRLAKNGACRDREHAAFLQGYSPFLKDESQPASICTWASDEARMAQVNSTDHNGRLAIAYHIWDECKDKRLPFQSAESFREFLGALRLSKIFPYHFEQKTPVPLSRDDATDAIRLTCQTPHFAETTLTMTLSYMPASKTTFAFVSLCRGEMEYFLDVLRPLAELCKSPLLLPTVLCRTMSALLFKRLEKVQKKLKIVEIHNGKLKHIHSDEQAAKDRNCDRSHIDLVEMHFELTRGLREYLEQMEMRLVEESSLPQKRDADPHAPTSGITTRSVNGAEDLHTPGVYLSVEQKDLTRLIRTTRLEVQAHLDRCKRMERRIDMQIDVLNNFKQSRIAEATYMDSTAMKALAFITMIFLPPNALASVFGANGFFMDIDDGKITAVTGVFSRIYVPTSILLIVAVFLSWMLWTYWYHITYWVHRHSRTKSHRSGAEGQPLPMRGVDIEPLPCARLGRQRRRELELERGFAHHSEPLHLGRLSFLQGSGSQHASHTSSERGRSQYS